MLILGRMMPRFGDAEPRAWRWDESTALLPRRPTPQPRTHATDAEDAQFIVAAATLDVGTAAVGKYVPPHISGRYDYEQAPCQE